MQDLCTSLRGIAGFRFATLVVLFSGSGTVARKSAARGFVESAVATATVKPNPKDRSDGRIAAVTSKEGAKRSQSAACSGWSLGRAMSSGSCPARGNQTKRSTAILYDSHRMSKKISSACQKYGVRSSSLCRRTRSGGEGPKQRLFSSDLDRPAVGGGFLGLY